MKKEKVLYKIIRSEGKPIQAKREIPYEISLQARLILDEICFKYNKAQLKKEINLALETRNHKEFLEHSAMYKQFVWE